MGTRRQTILNEKEIKKEVNEERDNIQNESAESFACCGCNRTFSTQAGCRRHMGYCAAVDGSLLTVDKSNMDNSSGPENNLRGIKNLEDSDPDNPREKQDDNSLQQQMKGENGFTCIHCNKAFNRRYHLFIHVKCVHEGAKPYECNQCSKTFGRKESLVRHTILHSDVKAHKCPICQKRCALKSSLKIHLLTHKKEPPRSCDECGRAFIRQDCLLRHMRTMHRDILEEIFAETEKKKLQQQLLAAAAAQGTSGSGVGMNGDGSSGSPGSTPSLSETALADSVRELLALLVDEATLKAFGWPETQVDQLLEAVIRRCGHQPVTSEELLYTDRLRENAKLLFTIVIDDSAVKTLLNNQTVDEVILHVLRLAKS